MIPGKKYRPEDFLWIVWRRKWLIVIPFVAVSLGTFAGSQLLPNRYRAETVILIVPQRVPEDYVRSTVTTRIEDRLQMISQQILSRTRLERIIQEFNLYPDDRKTLIMEDVIERMRKDIGLDVVNNRRREGAGAFSVSYESEDARTAMLVTERLASLFIKENLQDREVLADATNQFLETQLEDARRRLIEQEKKLEVYRQAHSGELPTQLESNLQVIQNMQLQLQALAESLNRDRDRRLALERWLADASAPDAVPESATGAAAEGDRAQSDPTAIAGASAAQKLQAAREMLNRIELRLKPVHPDVVRLTRLIVDLEKQAEQEALEQPLSPQLAPRAVSPARSAKDNRLREMRAELESLDQQMAYKQQEEARLRGVIAEYQRRVEKAPTRESELVELTRDYDTLQQIYRNLLVKKEDSKIAVNLERRQIGEQFKILDGARLPEKPISPNRLRINLMGALAGLAVGLGLVFLLEYRDTSLKTDDDVAVTLALPVLAMIPVMTTALERRRSRRRKLVLSLTAATTVVACASAIVWKFRVFEQ